jgi:hemolysin D
VGEVVNPAQPLVELIPADVPLEIEAHINNRDIGFVRVGQDAAVKIEAFNFTRFGIVAGELARISPDAVPTEHAGLAFPAVFTLSSKVITVADKKVALSPCMSVSVEIKTGTRRLLEFFLSPLVRFSSESMRER